MPIDHRNSRRPGPALDRLAVECARLTYEHGLSRSQVQERIDVRDQRDYKGLLDRARSLIEVTVTEIDDVVPPVDTRLGVRLTALLGAHAIVIDVDEPTHVEGMDPREPGRYLHDQLGRAAAERLLIIARAEDRIAVCSGRGVGYTVEHVARRPQHLRAQPSKNGDRAGEVVSLAGGIFLKAWEQGPGLQHLDNADHNAERLAETLGRQAQLCAARAYRGSKDDRDLTIAMDAHHLTDAGTAIDIALYGAGVVDEGHYLLRITDDPQARAIEPERTALRQLLADARHHGTIVDHCEHFYGVAGALPADPRVYALARSLNEKIVAASPDVIERARERMLVAGGRQKRKALMPLGSDDWRGPRPTTLVTDRATALALLGEHEG
jgi:DNA-binding transcriptional regulator LsrR (DeoR family)